MNPILVPTLAELSTELEREIALLKMLEAALNEQEAMSGRAVPKGDASDIAYNSAVDRCCTLAREIAELPAQTLQDLRVKAQALAWHAFPDGREPAPADERLAFQLVRGLLDGLPGSGQ